MLWWWIVVMLHQFSSSHPNYWQSIAGMRMYVYLVELTAIDGSVDPSETFWRPGGEWLLPLFSKHFVVPVWNGLHVTTYPFPVVTVDRDDGASIVHCWHIHCMWCTYFVEQLLTTAVSISQRLPADQSTYDLLPGQLQGYLVVMFCCFGMNCSKALYLVVCK